MPGKSNLEDIMGQIHTKLAIDTYSKQTNKTKSNKMGLAKQVMIHQYNGIQKANKKNILWTTWYKIAL